MTATTLAALLAFAIAPPGGPATSSSTEPAAEQRPDERARVKVLVLAPSGGGITDDERTTIAGLIAVELETQEGLDVVSARELQRMAELEAEKVQLGCNDASCLTELAGALGARYVVFGDAGKLGSLLVLNLSLFDSERAASRGRVAIKTRDLESLPAELAPALETLVAGVLEEAGWRSSAPRVAGDAGGGAPLAGVVLPWGLIGAGALVTTTGSSPICCCLRARTTPSTVVTSSGRRSWRSASAPSAQARRCSSSTPSPGRPDACSALAPRRASVPPARRRLWARERVRGTAVSLCARARRRWWRRRR